MLKCARCKKEKPEADFRYMPKKGRHYHLCRICEAESIKEQNIRHNKKSTCLRLSGSSVSTWIQQILTVCFLSLSRLRMRLKRVKVRDLVKCSSGFLTDMEVVIRENGNWVYGWRIGPHAKIYRYEHCAEYREQRGQFGIDAVKLKPGESVDVTKWPPDGCPMTVMCVKPEEAPEEVLDLEVNYYQPRHMPEFHGEQLTHNDFSLEIVCNVPDLMISPEKVKAWILKNHSEVKQPKEATEDIDGQMSLDQFYQTEKI